MMKIMLKNNVHHNDQKRIIFSASFCRKKYRGERHTGGNFCNDATAGRNYIDTYEIRKVTNLYMRVLCVQSI